MQEKPVRARIFYLIRDQDESGVSGTGVVAEGCEFTNGKCAISWLDTSYGYESIVACIKAVEGVHGHHGKTRVVFEEDLEKEKIPPRKTAKKEKKN